MTLWAKTIHEFAADGDVEGVRAALDQGVVVDSRDSEDFTPLARAVGGPSNALEVATLLIARGADLNALVENAHMTVLGHAARSGNLSAVQMLIDSGATVDLETRSGYTALINGTYGLFRSEHLVPMINLLAKAGADVNSESDYGERPLNVALGFGRFDAVRTLVNLGATPPDWSELTRMIVLGTDEELARYLHEEPYVFDDLEQWQHRKPGMLAVMSGSLEKCQLLHDRGWNVNDCDRNHTTALMVSAQHGHADIARWLIAKGAKVNAVNSYRDTALKLAVEAESAEVVQLLLDAGADVRIGNEFNETPMSVASTIPIARMLQRAGADWSELNTEMKRTFTGIAKHRAPECTLDEFEAGKSPRYGTANPQRMEIPFWNAMVRSGWRAYAAKVRFEDKNLFQGPVWCLERFGCSFTELPDGRFVQIAGEHEDHYDPDFCIYNDVIVHTGPDEFQIYGYPRELFPPTDFHTATLAHGDIYIVGGLGYQNERKRGTTPVYRLSCEDFSITPLVTTGENPGWIFNHRARLVGSDEILISGGKVEVEADGKGDHRDLSCSYVLDLASLKWTRK